MTADASDRDLVEACMSHAKVTMALQDIAQARDVRPGDTFSVDGFFVRVLDPDDASTWLVES